jgi:plasmid stability protein
MATLTIPDLDEDLDRALQAAAASQGVSKEELARRGLVRIVADATQAELDQSSCTGAELLKRLRSRFSHGYAIDLQLPPRQSSLRPSGLNER